MRLYAMAYGNEISRERFRVANISISRWKADYLFGVWEVYHEIIDGVAKGRIESSQFNNGAPSVNTELPAGWLEQRDRGLNAT